MIKQQALIFESPPNLNNPGTEKMKSNLEYIKQPSKCPGCNSEELEYDTLDYDAGEVYQPVFCHDCELKWLDIYRLNRFEARS